MGLHIYLTAVDLIGGTRGERQQQQNGNSAEKQNKSPHKNTHQSSHTHFTINISNTYQLKMQLLAHKQLTAAAGPRVSRARAVRCEAKVARKEGDPRVIRGKCFVTKDVSRVVY